MTRALSIFGALLLVATSTALAGTTQDQMAARMDTMAKDVMVKGCLAAADAKGLYRLTHATEPVAAMGDASMKAKPDAMMAGGETMAKPTYMLASMKDLKAHVGHTIEVTGTMAPTHDMKDMKDMKDMHGVKDMKTLTLKSFTMVAAACQ